MSWKWVLPVVALALVGWAMWNVFGSQRDRTGVRAAEAQQTAAYAERVAGSGIVEPYSTASGTATVAVGTDLPGVVAEVFVEPLQKVKKGDRLFKLDTRAKEAELKVKKATLAAAEKQLTKLELSPRPEEILPLEAKVRAATATVLAATDAYDRARHAGIAVTAVELQSLRQAAERARQEQAQAQKELDLLKAGTWKPDLDIARATVDQAKAAVEQTETDLKRLEVRAPMDGSVLQVNVRAGEAVSAQPGQALVMMGDLRVLHVRVSIDESDIGQFKTGTPAKAKTRGVPQQTLPLKFVRIEPYVVPKKSLTGDNTERVDTRVMQAIYAIDMANPPVQLGEQVDVFIKKDRTKK
jgi:multidrug resistance efflux pump